MKRYDCLSAGVLVADHHCAPISHCPKPGELVLTEGLPLTIGGCAANAAVDLARQKVSVGVLGCVGNDPFGAYLKDSLSAAGVGVDSMETLEDASTSGTLIINVRGEDRRFVHMAGANNRFTVDRMPLDLVLSCKVLYVGGYLLLAGLDPLPLRDLFAKARAKGIITVMDVVLPGPGDHWRRVEPVLAETDVFLPNEDEGRAITGKNEPIAQAEVFLAAGAKTVVITSGGEGAIVMSDKLRLKTTGYRMPVAGPTGAGDAFDAGYITGLLDGGDPRRCLAYGSALGASCVRSVGATDSVFTRQEATRFLDENPLEIKTF